MAAVNNSLTLDSETGIVGALGPILNDIASSSCKIKQYILIITHLCVESSSLLTANVCILYVYNAKYEIIKEMWVCRFIQQLAEVIWHEAPDRQLNRHGGARQFWSKAMAKNRWLFWMR